jgi:hypothetical protein
MKQQRAIIKIMVYNLQSSIHQNPLEIEKHWEDENNLEVVKEH